MRGHPIGRRGIAAREVAETEDKNQYPHTPPEILEDRQDFV